MHSPHLNCVLLDTGSGCASPLSIDSVAFGVGTWSTSRFLTVQVGQTVLDRYKILESLLFEEMDSDREGVGMGWTVMGRGEQKMDRDREGAVRGWMGRGWGWGRDGW